MARERRTRYDDGTYDEIVRTDCSVHIERLDDKAWMLAIGKPDGSAEVYTVFGDIQDNYEYNPKADGTYDEHASGWPS